MPLELPTNPYVGVNAHLHSLFQAEGGWDAFHNAYIGELHAVLGTSLLPQGYVVDMTTSLQIRERDPNTGQLTRSPSRLEADLGVRERGRAALPVMAGAVAGSATIVLPIRDTLGLDEAAFLQALAIREYKPGEARFGRVIAWIEILSPTNKPGGRHSDAYFEKRLGVIRAGLVLVEVDLIHWQHPVIEGLPSYPHTRDANPYAIGVSDPRPSPSAGMTTVYPFGVDDPIPSVAVNLASDAALVLDFASAYWAVTARPSYALMLDYAARPAYFHSYSSRDQAKIIARMETVRASSGL